MSNKKNNNSNDHNDKINHNDNNHNNNDDDDDDINNNDCKNDDKTIIDRFMITLTNWRSLIMIVVIIIIIIDHHDDLGVVKMIIVVVIIIITMPLVDSSSSSSSAAAAAATASSGHWWMVTRLFHLFLNYMNWIRETYSNDSAFIMLVIVSYCGQQIYFTYKMQLRFVVKQSRWPWIIGIWYHIGKSRQSIEILTYIMDVLHMFATAKTGDSHMNRLQSIRCLIVSGLGGTVIVGGRCNTRIVRLAIWKIAITFLILGRSLPNFSQTWAMFRCNTYVILKKI